MHKSLFLVVKYQVCALKMLPKVFNIQLHSTEYSKKEKSNTIQYQRNYLCPLNLVDVRFRDTLL